MAGDHVQFESPMPSSGLRLADDDDDDEQASPTLVEAKDLQLFSLVAVCNYRKPAISSIIRRCCWWAVFIRELFGSNGPTYMAHLLLLERANLLGLGDPSSFKYLYISVLTS